MACDLSIIIVNYNVRYFLEYCLLAVRKASIGIRVQVIVVDNASTDGDYAGIRQKFSEMSFVNNAENQGFGKASNHGLALATGELVLFLNPDTIVPENALKDCLRFFRKNADCGALGVQMVDGKGRFLPESKRSVPTPLVSFYKLSGLEKLFPKSKTFGQYALGYLDKDGTFEVPVLAGAFLMARHSLLKKVGGFDEAFFMYGEDIDLSFRLQHRTGFSNYFLGAVKILHFKGESSKQNALHYNKVFHDAMRIFVKKYQPKAKAFLMSAFIGIGTQMRTRAIRGKKKEENREEDDIASRHFFLWGDTDTRRLLSEKIALLYPNIPLSDTASAADSTILCIGENYSYENALKDTAKQPGSVDIFWFDAEASAVIGSHDKDETGIVWKLEKA